MILASLSIVILFYALVLLFASKVWRNLPELNKSGELKSVTIIIPFRNEADNLKGLLESLAALDYPADLLEILLINDHSEDDFKRILSSVQSGFPFEISIMNLPLELSGKKLAIDFGVQQAKSEIIVTSDADCFFSTDWIQKMQSPFEIDYIELVSGSVVFRAKDLLSGIFQMEFAPLIGIGAVSIELGNATMANGANLAFRKSTFEHLAPYADNLHIPSGDDIFLLQKIKDAYPKGIFFQKAAVVESKAPSSMKAFYKQRKRWAAKWRANGSLSSAFPAVAVWLFHLVYLFAIVYGLVSNQFLVLAPVLLLKVITEGIFISSILKSQNHLFRLFPFVVLQLFYSLYVLIFGLLANFGKYTWKERKYNSNERAGN